MHKEQFDGSLSGNKVCTSVFVWVMSCMNGLESSCKALQSLQIFDICKALQSFAICKGLQSFAKLYKEVCKALQRFDVRTYCDVFLCRAIASTYVGSSMFPLHLLSRPFMQLVTQPKTKNIVPVLPAERLHKNCTHRTDLNKSCTDDSRCIE